jgi:hypothetical protein
MAMKPFFSSITFSLIISLTLPIEAKQSRWTVVDLVKANTPETCVTKQHSDINGHGVRYCIGVEVTVNIKEGYLRGWAFDPEGRLFVARQFAPNQSLMAVHVLRDKSKRFKHQMLVVHAYEDNPVLVDARYVWGSCGECELDPVRN